VERRYGHRALLDVMCDPVRLMSRYDDAARSGMPTWSEELMTLLLRPS
jgi:hypothetical protein